VVIDGAEGAANAFVVCTVPGRLAAGLVLRRRPSRSAPPGLAHDSNRRPPGMTAPNGAPFISYAVGPQAVLERNEDRYVDTPTGDAIFLRLAHDPADNLNSMGYQPNVNYRLLSMVAERYASPQR